MNNGNGRVAPARPRGRRVAWNIYDRRGMLMLTWGLSNRAVTGATGLTAGQIAYRAKKLGITLLRREYRNAESQLAKYVLTHTAAYANRVLGKHIQNVLE